ncbi:cupin domain-containing protein [Gordonia neofelifaecis]|uniref:cupin domain-containing protein n=1 Tax=Gordonia neofelifaecis TaxID=945692 RepID=UPI001EE6488F|nr:cupin domain-containing protein [Gordonia neofelifaecis]
MEGSFVWHSHPDTDELFIVLDGSLDIQLRETGEEATAVHLERHDVFVVPRGPSTAHGRRTAQRSCCSSRPEC